MNSSTTKHKQFSLPDQANETAVQKTSQVSDFQQYNLPNQIYFGVQNRDFVSSGNVLQTAKAVKFDQGIALGDQPDTQAKMPVRGQYYSISYPNSTVTATANIDWARGNTQRAGITQTTTLTFTNVKPGGRYILEIQQDETGSRAITWPSTVVWPAGTAPTASGALKVDLYAFYNNGSSTFGSSSLNY